MTRLPRPFPLLALAAVIALAVSACGGSSSPSASVPKTTSSTQGASGAAGVPGAGKAGASTGKSGKSSPAKGPAARKARRALAARSIKSGLLRNNPGLLALRECLRKNGVQSVRRARGTKLRAAMARCAGAERGASRKRRLASPAYRGALVAFTSCMRTHRVPNFPEPDTSGNGPIFGGARVALNPQVRAAEKACIHVITAARKG